MATDPQHMRMTEEEYLAFDRASEFKHEYDGDTGEVVAMAGGKAGHSRLAVRMVSLLELQLGNDATCRVFNSDMRVLVAKNKYVYPDVVVSCDISDYRDLDNDILRSPHLIVEILSSSTERHDRGKKMHWYQAQRSTQEYVLVNTRVRLVEVFRRVEQDRWLQTKFGPGQVAKFESLDVEVRVDELYARLAIPVPPEGV